MVLSMERWKGKVAVVTGASSGIGAAIAKALLQEGLTVVGLARRVERVEELKVTGPGKLHAIKCDVSKEEDIKSAFEQIKAIGPVHILVNNAGVYKDATLLEGDAEQWRVVMDTNVLGLCIATSIAIKDMQSNSVDGHVIHINSVAGHNVPNLGRGSMYPVSKFGVTAATEVLRQELVWCKSKIKISSVSPGMVESEMTKEVLETQMELLQCDPLKAADIADTVVYILSTPPHVQIHDVIIKPVGERW